jgi:hypothetical protein
MKKKVILSTLLIALIGVMAAGAIIRTIDRSENVAEARGLERGRGGDPQPDCASEEPGQGKGLSNQAPGRGGYNEAQGTVERRYSSYESAPEEWVALRGAVVEAPAAGGDLVVETNGGVEVVVGTGPGYMEEQGFSLQAGEMVQVRGYWEDGELKAAELTRLRDGETYALRDGSGRPAWSGGNGNAAAPRDGEAGSNASAGFGGQGNGGAAAPGGGDAVGQAEVDEWLELHGTVLSVDDSSLVVETATGEEVAVENRAWWFAQEEGFSAQAGDQVTLLGFHEGDGFEAGGITNDTNGESVLIREESGRPLWAGGGRRGG